MLTLEERKEWVRRGFKDPKRAYLAQASGARSRHIEFKLTFAQWWEIWKDHYAQRGVLAGQLLMARTGDSGAYEVGNVRIATVKENAQEAALARLAKDGKARRTYNQVTPPPTGSWLWRRDVFAEYVEEEENA
jgi:hypothetical protein